jgi:hypothetical protein
MQAAKSTAVRLAVTLTFHQGRCAVKEDEQIGASVALIVVALGLVWLGLNGLTHLANKLDLALIKTDNATGPTNSLPSGCLRRRLHVLGAAADLNSDQSRDRKHIRPAAADVRIEGAFRSAQMRPPTGAALQGHGAVVDVPTAATARSSGRAKPAHCQNANARPLRPPKKTLSQIPT